MVTIIMIVIWQKPYSQYYTHLHKLHYVIINSLLMYDIINININISHMSVLNFQNENIGTKE